MQQTAKSLLKNANSLLRQDQTAGLMAMANILARYPGNTNAAKALGANPLEIWQVLMKLGRSDQAADYIRRAKSLDANTRARLAGSALLKAGQIAKAKSTLEPALKGASSAVWNNYGSALRMLGQANTARAAFRTAVGLNPTDAQAWYNLALTNGCRQCDLPTMKDTLSKVGQDQKPLMHFAIANLLDAVEDFDQAFQHFKLGNQLRRTAIGYNFESDAALFKHLKSLTPKPLEVDDTDRVPVFLVGLPRSGSTLLERMLSRHTDVTGAGELTALAEAVSACDGLNAPLDQPRLTRIRAHYLAALPDTKTTTVIDKMPLNFRLLSIAAAALPEARFIDLRRSPMANCWSIYRHYFTDAGRTNGFAWDLQDLARYHGLYTDLMDHWRSNFAHLILTLNYEDLVQDPERQLGALFRFLDLPPDLNCLHPELGNDPVLTASALQVRQPIYQGASEAWRAYAAHLEPLENALNQ